MPALNFDANKVEPIGSFEPVPIGEYPVVISASEMKDTKDMTGKYLQLTFTVIDGEYKGRKLFERLNLVNQNQTAQEIAQRSLSAICYVTGVMKPTRSEELHDKPMIVKVGIRPAKDEYAASNIIKEYKFADGTSIKDATTAKKAKGEVAAPATTTAPPAEGAAPAAAGEQPSAATGTSKMPWNKGKGKK